MDIAHDMFEQSAERAKCRKDPQTYRCDYDDSHAIRAARQRARANHSHPLVRANPTGDSGGQRLSALPLHPSKGG
jgi:hypothetical protein